MQLNFRTRSTAYLALSIAMLSLMPSTQAQNFYGLTVDNRLVQFTGARPTDITSSKNITGLTQPNELILGIDIRPKTGEIYGLGSSSNLYKINAATGVATQVGAMFTTVLSGVEFGFDFNPTVDRIRVTSNTGQNMRLHPDTGAVVAVDGALNYAAGDPNVGKMPYVAGSAYTNSFDGSTSTTLYNIDSDLDILVSQVPPNSGTLNTIGGLGLDVSSLVGFDILTAGGENFGYAALTRHGDFRSSLYSIDLSTGKARLMDAIGGDVFQIRDIAVVPEPATFVALGLGVAALARRRRISR